MTLYYTRSQWGADGAPGGYRIGKVYEVIAHHAYRPHVEASATHTSEAATVRSIQRYHKHDQGWADVGYQWLVFQSGRAYEGRGWFHSGAHTAGRNTKSVGICFVIDGDSHTPTDAAWAKARAIIGEGIRVGALDEDYKISGHCDYAGKSCPGDRTYPLIRTNLRAGKEAPVPSSKYAQAVIGHTDVDIEQGRVLAQAYDLALVRLTEAGDLLSETHPGHKAHVDYAFLIGQAATRAGHIAFEHGQKRLRGADRDGTAEKVGRFIESHRRETMSRRGRPWG